MAQLDPTESGYVTYIARSIKCTKTMKLHFCLFVISAILLFNSRSNAQSNNIFIIKGVIDTIPFAQYFLAYKSNGEQIRDTIILNKDREFEYSGDLTEPTILRLEIPNTFNSRS